jgi:hypothetical protein
MSQSGSTSIVVLTLLIFVSVLFLGTGALVELSLRQLRRSEDRDREVELLRGQADQVVEFLLEDPTPFADSPQDPVWSRISALSGRETAVGLRDISSRIGPNWIRKEPLATLGLLRAERSPQELQQFREDGGLHLNLRPAFEEYFSEEALDTVCTAYGYFNINVSDEFVLRKLHYLRAGDLAAAEAFHSEIQRVRIAGETVEPDGLEAFLGESYPLLFPLVNAEPVMNVYYVPERIVKGLFRHYEVPLDRAERILAERRTGEWTPAQLAELIGAGAQAGPAALRQYLGLQTWFWEIRIGGPERELTWTLARIPGGSQPEYRLIEERVRP